MDEEPVCLEVVVTLHAGRRVVLNKERSLYLRIFLPLTSLEWKLQVIENPGNCAVAKLILNLLILFESFFFTFLPFEFLPARNPGNGDGR